MQRLQELRRGAEALGKEMKGERRLDKADKADTAFHNFSRQLGREIVEDEKQQHGARDKLARREMQEAKEWRKNKMNNLRFLYLISMLLSVPCLTVPLSKAFAGSSIP